MGLLSVPLMMHSMVRRGSNLGFALYSDFAAQNFSVNEIARSFDYIYDFSRPSSKWVWGTGAQTGQLIEVPAGEQAIQHDPVTGEPLGVLLEPSATNYIADSTRLDLWTVIGANGGASLSGETFAGLDVYSVSGLNGLSYNKGVIASGTTQTFWVIAAAGTSDEIIIRFGNPLGGNGVFSFSLGEFTTAASNIETHKVELYGGYWVLGITTTFNENQSSHAIYVPTDGDNVKVAFAQSETGAKPTSPIITNGSQQTRAADLLNSDPATFGEWYRTSGTLTVTAKADVGDIVARLGSIEIVADVDTEKEYSVTYTTDPLATELELLPSGNGYIKQVTFKE